MKEIPWIFFRTLPKRSIGTRLHFLIYLQRVETGWEAAGQIKNTCTYEMNNLWGFFYEPIHPQKTPSSDMISSICFPLYADNQKQLWRCLESESFTLYRLSCFIFDLSFLYSYHSCTSIYSVKCFLTFLEVWMLMILFYYTGICADGLSNGYDIYLKVVYSVSL